MFSDELGQGVICIFILLERQTAKGCGVKVIGDCTALLDSFEEQFEGFLELAFLVKFLALLVIVYEVLTVNAFLGHIDTLHELLLVTETLPYLEQLLLGLAGRERVQVVQVVPIQVGGGDVKGIGVNPPCCEGVLLQEVASLVDLLKFELIIFEGGRSLTLGLISARRSHQFYSKRRLHSPFIPLFIPLYPHRNAHIHYSSMDTDCQIFVFQCPQNHIQLLKEVFTRIETTYITFKFLQDSHDTAQQMAAWHAKASLTKRRICFALLNPQQSVLPAHTVVCFREAPVTAPHSIYLPVNASSQYVQSEVVKLLQLDIIWIGLLYRLGTNVTQLMNYMIDAENFKESRVGLIDIFLQNLEESDARYDIDHCLKRANEGMHSNRKNLMDTSFTFSEEECELQRQTSVDKFLSQRKVEEEKGAKLKQQIHLSCVWGQDSVQQANADLQRLIRQQFNSRMIIADVTSHEFVHLLYSRNYFHLLYIEEDLLSRHSHFCSLAQTKYPRLHQRIFKEGLECFISIDEYIYSQFIINEVKNAQMVINRIINKQPYSEIVKSSYKNIIRMFRPTIDEYFISICRMLKKRSACLKQAVGAIIVKDKHIVSTGYNGTPVGTVNCYNGGCKVCNNSEIISTEVLSCRCIHAEYGCIITAGLQNTPGTTLYSTKLPCLWCIKLIIQSRIVEVVYLKSKYRSLEYENEHMVKTALKKSGILLTEHE